jgi:hypothetical protein
MKSSTRAVHQVRSIRELRAGRVLNEARGKWLGHEEITPMMIRSGDTCLTDNEINLSASHL